MLNYDDMIGLLEVADDVTVDTEGVSRMLGFSVAFDHMPVEGYYFPFTHVDEENNLNEKQQKKLLAVLNSRRSLIFFNALHDLRVLFRHGLDYRGVFYDPMLMQHWINEELGNYKLENVSRLHGFDGKNMPAETSAFIAEHGWDMLPSWMIDIYGATDSWITHGTFRSILPEFKAQGFDGELWEIEQKFIRDVMLPMKELGIKVNLDFAIQEYLKGTTIMKECRDELAMNPGSSIQLKKLLVDELGLPVLKHTASCKDCKARRPLKSHEHRAAFDKKTMDEYDALLERSGDKRAQTILRYRGWQKVTSATYKSCIDLVDDEGVVRPNYKLHGTKTSRLSCEQPNFQQIPKSSEKEWNGNSKQVVQAREGFALWEFDYSQLQFRMTVAYAKQMDLVKIFLDRNRDIFEEMANDMGWTRNNVKTLVYLILFGGGALQAQVSFALKTINQGKRIINEFHKKYPKIRTISDEAQAAASVQGYIEYWTGRRRHFFRNGAPTYRAFNAAIQGGEAEIVKRTMIALQEKVCDENCRMVLQIHDAIAFEIRKGMEDFYRPMIVEVMEETPKQFCEFVGIDMIFPVEGKLWGTK